MDDVVGGGAEPGGGLDLAGGGVGRLRGLGHRTPSFRDYRFISRALLSATSLDPAADFFAWTAEQTADTIGL
ncbi:hypothetical protein ACH4E7_23110 [Kitasatospora sp. NPDC018058]|uniref:hypothetical protein n=1 Tax=Kitasatospora sp. NPDC018058 TaxID=3364025 RepID=UPI0037BFCD61